MHHSEKWVRTASSSQGLGFVFVNSGILRVISTSAKGNRRAGILWEGKQNTKSNQALIYIGLEPLCH
jgi:hypothetical protein